MQNIKSHITHQKQIQNHHCQTSQIFGNYLKWDNKNLKSHNNVQNEKGAIFIVVLIITSIFVLAMGSMVTFALLQQKLGIQRISWERSLQIAENGINYYRWHLSHDPDDYTDGTGTAGPYIHDVNDPQAGKIGEYSLEITAPTACSNTVVITSTGSTIENPNLKRVVRAEYSQPSLAEFSFLTNSNVWFGSNEELSGPVHANGGIRQDGNNDGLLTSSKETYLCGTEHGCSDEIKPGIWGAGQLQSLWTFPTETVDFDVITMDFVSLKSEAQSNGIYFASSGLGYHVILLNDGSIDVYQVDQLMPDVDVWDGFDQYWTSNDIKTETLLGNYLFPNSCPIIFIEDNVWVEGQINNQRATIVSAKLPELPETNTNIIINGNITYQTINTSTSLALIAQKDIIIPLYAAPDDLTVNAILLAKQGHVFRHYYTSTYSPYHLRNSISLYGAIITNSVWTWSWVDGMGTVVSGYINSSTVYDPSLKYNPPPGFPTSMEYDFIKWEEITDKQ